jgi:peptide deformylase
MALTLRYVGDPVLRAKGAPVTEFGPMLEQYLPDMVKVMRAEGGVGLAAPQVGLSLHFFIVVVNVDDEERKQDEILLIANARILERSKEEVIYDEGCLSIPGLREDLARPERIRVSFQDMEGKRQELDTDGLLARAIQHEIDHCEGVLFIDRLSSARRALLRKRIAEIEAEHARA